MQVTGIPSIESTPPSYGEIQPSAPPYNPYYKGSFHTNKSGISSI